MRWTVPWGRPATEPSRESAAASLLAVAVLALTAALGAGVLHLGATSVDRARLASSADLVALAAVTGGPGAARDVAAANGVSVVGLDDEGPVVVVEVAGPAGRATAAARPATDRPAGPVDAGQHGG